MSTIKDQPPPLPQPARAAVWSLVIDDYRRDIADSLSAKCADDPIDGLVLADMAERDRVGRERYGVPLTTGNGRDHLVDAYQEALDFAVYLRAWLEENLPSDADSPRVRVARFQLRRSYLDQLRMLWNLRRLMSELSELAGPPAPEGAS